MKLPGKNLAGLQFSMVFDQDKFEFKGIEQGAANVTEDDIYVLDNTLLMSWANSKKDNEENGKLFGLTFVAKQDVAAGEWFNLNDRMLKSSILKRRRKHYSNLNGSGIER
ncbi:MAG: hypothetical protein IPO65_20425 [Saprospiraceae bacterium]|nr:hypothetical protein [Saprospiraceae bacterium]